MNIKIKMFTKNSTAAILIISFMVIAFGFTGPTTARAAAAPDLGAAAGYSVFGNAGITETAGQLSHLWGNAGGNGFGHDDLIASQVDGAIDAGANAPVVGAISSAYGDLAGEAQTGAIDLAASPTVVPGVYDVAATAFNSTLTLDGEGVYIFRSTSSIAQTAGGTMLLTNNACASNVFWQIPTSMTFAAAGNIEGTIITNTGLISFVSGVNLKGRAWAATQVTMDNNQITEPVCAPAPATLHVVKTVVNDNGGTAVASDFTIDVAGTNVSNPSFAGSAAGVDVTLDAGAYAVTETSLPGYLQSGSGDCSGTIAAGETKTCTITNNDIAPQLIVNKVVVNDNGGTKVISDFPLFIDGSSVTSGVASTTTVGSHTVSETSDSGYTATIGGDCAADGTITLALGDVMTCTVTNDDIAPVVVPPPPSGGGSGGGPSPIPPLIDVVKVPNPLALPGGSGPVTYTYTLSNIGTIPVTNITMVGDTCDPITLVSGDTNADGRLDVDETWIYTCSTTLSETHTNIVTATGWGYERGYANGINATDTANATVIVGLPVVPPLIHVTKVPNPLVLSAGGGMVTYTNKVTNPGTVALSNVRLTDDKCGPVEFISGDTNGNSMLDTTETWTYTCSANLTKNTVNTVTASGDANGLTARDFAIATVVLNAAVDVVPKLPDTGLPPSENNTPWNVIIPAGILAILTSLYFARRKQTA